MTTTQTITLADARRRYEEARRRTGEEAERLGRAREALARRVTHGLPVGNLPAIVASYEDDARDAERAQADARAVYTALRGPLDHAGLWG